MGERHRAGREDPLEGWLTALEGRHLADLRLSEVTRALRALSSAYVERRGRLDRGAALDGAGKRAAFALFYGPLHFFATRHVVRALGAAAGRGELVLDLGCGTGVAGAAWALEYEDAPRILGLERHPWAVDEARWTYRAMKLDGTAQRVDLARARLGGRTSAIVAAFTINELPDPVRGSLLEALLAAAEDGRRVLIVEPIARSIGPWWAVWRRAFEQAGGRADEWRFQVELPGIVGQLDRAAGMDHSELTARSLYLARPKPLPG